MSFYCVVRVTELSVGLQIAAKPSVTACAKTTEKSYHIASHHILYHIFINDSPGNRNSDQLSQNVVKNVALTKVWLTTTDLVEQGDVNKDITSSKMKAKGYRA